VWDLRETQTPKLTFKNEVIESASSIKHNVLTFSAKLKFYEEQNELVAQFRGGDDIYKFDMRMSQILDRYSFHQFPIASFDTGKGLLERIGVSSGLN